MLMHDRIGEKDVNVRRICLYKRVLVESVQISKLQDGHLNCHGILPISAWPVHVIDCSICDSVSKQMILQTNIVGLD